MGGLVQAFQSEHSKPPGVALHNANTSLKGAQDIFRNLCDLATFFLHTIFPSSRSEEKGGLAMSRFISAIVLGGFLSAVALPTLAQTPKGPQDCKSSEQWDAATKTCKMKK